MREIEIDCDILPPRLLAKQSAEQASRFGRTVGCDQRNCQIVANGIAIVLQDERVPVSINCGRRTAETEVHLPASAPEYRFACANHFMRAKMNLRFVELARLNIGQRARCDRPACPPLRTCQCRKQLPRLERAPCRDKQFGAQQSDVIVHVVIALLGQHIKKRTGLDQAITLQCTVCCADQLGMRIGRLRSRSGRRQPIFNRRIPCGRA
jgi:hypothetical protein